ncbi:DUF6504 family protein [Deinococcus koreensis]|uniref:DUF6504 domain-containing protein n=1 Tax=Deinococcus koreensis TaxID=2054903 RepID=A0A2K3UXI7_9DEIO|nr:DUF6504 family protein [Deinococcus koreensis]PNY81247.1 hypothetical protein CVO96_07490 [Deinococcus koreensis]
MRVVSEPVQVQVRGGTPQALLWRSRRYAVRSVLDEWRAAGRWWLHEAPRDYWLLDTPALTAEVYRTRTQTGFTWMLSRIAD